MSKTIEFIDEKIKMLNVAIESAVKIVKEFDGIVPVDSYKKLVEEHLKEIQTLEQIKCELEAWEVVKKELNLKIVKHKCNVFHTNYALECDYTGVIPLFDEEFNLCEKSLEVEDERNN